MTIDEAVQHCTTGLGVWKWASSLDANGNLDPEPDVVMACCGDVPTLETLAAVTLLRQEAPDVKVRVVNVVDLMTLQPTSEHPHGLSDEDFDAAFTKGKPIIFAFHGYPWVIHRLTYRRHDHDNIHVRGYKEEGTTTTPFDMCVRNNIDRYQLALDAILRIPRLAPIADAARQRYSEQIQKHRLYVAENGQDLPEIRNWKWSQA
jgi:xylulose-5-phosphate/fructose-6-phosphate phosphoketolase